MNIILMGTQGCGKGTQAVKLSKYFNIPTITMGEVLREEIEKGTELGKLAASYMNKGMLVPDDLVSSIVRKKLQREEYGSGAILDGYPRNIVQAEELDTYFQPDYVILLEISDGEAIKRVTGRRICSKCGENFHTLYRPPQSEGKCDKCGTKLEIREDSTPEVVETRLEVYHLQTEPLIGYYEKKGILVRVDGERSISEVYEDIISKIKEHEPHH